MTPADIPVVNRILRREFKRNKAPIVDLVKAKTGSPFKILVATLLSARTKDECTAEVCGRLFGKVSGMEDLKRIEQHDLEGLIYPVGFYHTKARHLKQLPDAVESLFGGRIPETIEALCELPGVGRKTANLVVALAFDKPAICVDVHVHRISNRLGLVSTRTPFETEMALRGLLPVRYWKTWNSQLVSFGQTVCRPVRPKCQVCPIAGYCSRIGVQPLNP